MLKMITYKRKKFYDANPRNLIIVQEKEKKSNKY
jgi:hypothetical protein